MRGTQPTRSWDAPSVLFEVGRRVQAASQAMRTHELAAHDVCRCGRLPDRTLPVFGPRCEVASQSWDLAVESMERILAHMAGPTCLAPATGPRVVGRAAVHSASEPR